ncbi:MAG: prepilin peptidase, partial [Elusimicrobia bacterium]|nr:prepilin peptidase [Elusimicrobiota bacterium]
MSGGSSLALLLFVGGASAVADWRERRVPNRLILLGLGAAAALAAVQLAGSVLGSMGRSWLGLGALYMPWRWYPRLAAHAGLSLAAGWTLWKLDVWPAGDAKLYLALSALLPFVDPNIPGFPRLLFMVFLINVFVPAGLVFALEGLARGAASWAAALAGGPWLVAKAAADRGLVRLREFAALRWQAAALVVNLAALFFVLQAGERVLSGPGAGPLVRIAAFLLMYALWDRLAPVLRRPRAGFAALAAFLLAA